LKIHIETSGNRKAELTGGSSSGSSVIFALKDPPLSAPSPQRVWLYRVSHFGNLYIKRCWIRQSHNLIGFRHERPVPNIIDYGLKYCSVERKGKIKVPGRKR
jgi:hypothetical protein